MAQRIALFDTTLRDGEQAPGYSMNLEEKLVLARQLEALKVDVIEAGFAIASPGDFKAVKSVAENIKTVTVASLSRALEKDIDAAAEAVKPAAMPRIHTFIATSDIHMEYKLKMDRDAVLEQAVKMVKYARNLCGEVEFSAEDASRSDPAFLYKVFEEVIKAGACVINVPDTVGYTTPGEFAELITGIRSNVPNVDKAAISVHCHNDLGLAVANSLAAANAGATQIECTINGIGDRAGNAAVEEILMAIRTRKNIYPFEYQADTRQIHKTSKLLTTLTGVSVQPNKAVVGANAFAHEAGIHQHGVLSHKSTYEIMTPESIGLSENVMVLGKHSGRHAFADRLAQLGYKADKETVDKMFVKFKELADRKKNVDDRDIEALMDFDREIVEEIFTLDNYVINSGNSITATASVRLKKESESFEDVATGDGPVDAAFNAIERITGESFSLEDYLVHSVTGGKDAQGEVSVRLSQDERKYKGRGVSTDIIGASIKAYLSAVNMKLREAQNNE
jgi:2-isopropylmalate synthase